MAKQFINVKPDIEAVQDALAGTAAGLENIRKRTLGTIASGAKRRISQAIRLTTKKRSGELLKAYRYKVKKDGSAASLFPRGQGKSSRIFPKVYTLNYGKEGTKWAARGFVQRGELFVQGAEYEKDVNKYVQKELDKYWGD